MGEHHEQDQRDELLKLRHEYGQTYNVFEPSEEPAPHEWDRPLLERDEKGTLDPQALKHWRYFEKTRDFLRNRYAGNGILDGSSLVFDCLVPKLQTPLNISAEKRRRYKWHSKAIRLSGTKKPFG